MVIRKVNMDELFPPKEVKTFSEAVYVEVEPEPYPAKEMPAIDGQLIYDRLNTLTKEQPVYFPEYRLGMQSDRVGPRYRQPSKIEKARYHNAVRNRAVAMGLKVAIYWVKTKNSTVTMRVTLK